MKTLLLTGLFTMVAGLLLAQQSDYIVLRKRNNRTLKTYSPGIFISAETYSGFAINGYIQDIRNDSVFIVQEETRLMAAEFGTVLDTLRYTIGIPYQQIGRYHFNGGYGWGGRRKSFSNNFFPRLMMIGGIGFLVLEFVNTAYRKESLTQDRKPLALGVAAGVALGGFLWKTINENSKEANGIKYRVIYMKATGH